MKATGIIQARMGSSRLPGKVLRRILDRPMLAYQLERMRRSQVLDEIVVATSALTGDNVLEQFCREQQVSCFRGSETDVLSRFMGAVEKFGGDVIVRLTADCPLLEPELVDLAVQTYQRERCDYLSNMLEPTWPCGMAVEVFSRQALEEAQHEAVLPEEREHVTPFLYWRPARFRLVSLKRDRDLSSLRWTVDTPEDFTLVSRILESLYPIKNSFSLQDVLSLLEANPSWSEINKNVMQKQLTR